MKTFLSRFWDFIYAQIAVSLFMAFAILGTQVRFGLIQRGAVRTNVLSLLEPYLYFLIALAVWHLLHTSYVLYWEQEEKREVLLTEAANDKARSEALLQHKLAAVTGADWQQLADRFKEARFPISVSFQTTRGVTTWNFNDRGECKALCMKAGAMLLKSTNVYEPLGYVIKDESDHLSRWLAFVKLKRGTERYMFWTEEMSDGTKINTYSGVITNVAADSAVLCMECSAYET